MVWFFVSASILAIFTRMFAFKSCFTTKGSETSSVEPVDWRTEKALKKGSETSCVEPVFHVRIFSAQSPSCKDHNEGHRQVFVSLNDRKVQGRGTFAHRTSWELQDWNSLCLNVLRWSNGLKYSSSSSFRTPGLPERSDPCNNWFSVRNRVSWGYIGMLSNDALGYNHRQSIRKVGFDGKRTFLTTPTHDSDWLYFQGNFRFSSLEWKHAHPATTSTPWFPRIIKRKLCCRIRKNIDLLDLTSRGIVVAWSQHDIPPLVTVSRLHRRLLKA